jgi:1-deoxy-D-xylulose-5-phosphate reductoisomerase
MKKIALLGSTGSIGRQALEVISNMPHIFRVHSLAAGSRAGELAAQARMLRPRQVAVADPAAYTELKAELGGTGIRLLAGKDALCELASDPQADTVINAIVGFAGLKPTLSAAAAGKTVALANKESLVAGGHLVMPAVEAAGARLVPVDSEHSAVFQCLQGESRKAVERIVLTASGGPFYGRSREELADVTPALALKHPSWSMGPKISVDSATLMNKGLEVIEAHWLFAVPYEKIEVVIHRESIVHSLVEFVDGAALAQLGLPDMKAPIQYALTYPERLPRPTARVRWRELGRLHFAAPDTETFPCLELACLAGRSGGSLPAVLNAANEVAVERFLAGKCSFADIPRIIESVLNKHNIVHEPNLADLSEIDMEARRETLQSALIRKG